MNLEEKAIDIKGKKYVLVSDRILAFNEAYPMGCIQTRLISEPSSELVIIQALVTPDAAFPERMFTGYSQARWGDGFINKTSALENCETSAVGRALAMMGIGVIDSVASVDEINKAQTSTPVKEKEPLDETRFYEVLGYIQDFDNAEKLIAYVNKIIMQFWLTKDQKDQIDDAKENKLREFSNDIRQLNK